jgi:hypothetical protein
MPVAASAAGGAVSSPSAVIAAGSWRTGSGGGKTTNQTRITRKLSAVARMRLRF